MTISVEKHHSQLIAVIGHHDCASNPVSKEIQLGQIAKSIEKVRSWWPGMKVVGLWVNEMWTVEEVPV
ncbi:MAG: carbonic anhydrase [bacterium]